VSLFERGSKFLDFLAVLFLELGDLAGQGEDDRVVGLGG
jgi:hypothetical protein